MTSSILDNSIKSHTHTNIYATTIEQFSRHSRLAKIDRALAYAQSLADVWSVYAQKLPWEDCGWSKHELEMLCTHREVEVSGTCTHTPDM